VRRWASGRESEVATSSSSPSPREAGRGSGRGAASTLAALFLLLAPTAARANGAFPDSESILTPADRPQEIVLVTNFGLITTSDGGTTWLWSCEQEGNVLGAFYQLTPAPRNRLITVTNQNVGYSDDWSCGWQVGGGAVAGQSITDAYLDPVSGTRVMAIAVSSQVYSLFPSTDAGSTFGPAIYQAGAGETLTGVEIAQSDGNVVYLALRTMAGNPVLARSSDGGAHFERHDLGTDLGVGLLRIIAIDPQDPNRVLLRFLTANDQSVALTVDGGVSATKPITINGDFKAYTRLPSGTILIGAMTEFSVTPTLYRSRDRGATFESVPNPPAIRALSQRAGKVYAAADNFGDGYAIGTSSDEGTTWQSLMTYSEVKAINPCLKTACQDTCTVEVGMTVWPAAVCSADAPVSTGTAGSGGAGQGGGGGHAGSGSTGSGGSSGTGGTPPPPKHGGGCDVASAPREVSASALLLLVIAACFRARTRSTAPGRASRTRAKAPPRASAPGT